MLFGSIYEQERFCYGQVLQQLKFKALKRAGLSEDDVLRTIADRTLARKNKEYLKSDQIREEMERKGIQLMDVGNESIWRPCVPKEQEQKALPNKEEHKALPVGQKEPPALT